MASSSMIPPTTWARAVKRPPVSSAPVVSETVSSSWWASSKITSSWSGRTAPPAAMLVP